MSLIVSKGADPAEALGRLIVAFQEIESELTELFGLLLRQTNPRFPEIISTQLSFKNLLAVLDAMIRASIDDSSVVADFESISKRCNELENARNKFVHSHYEWTKISGLGVEYSRIKKRLKSKKGLKVDEQPITNEYPFNEVTEKLYKLSSEIREFNEQIFVKVATDEEIKEYFMHDDYPPECTPDDSIKRSFGLK